LSLPLSKAIGLEILPHLHEQAVRHCNNWRSDMNSIDKVEWDFRCADFTVQTDWIQQADLVFVHATVFETALLKTLNSLCEMCRVGTKFCMISTPLKEKRFFSMVAEFQLEMSWGRATVYIQQRSNDPASLPTII
jgi:hypothetical protein